jgi:transcriptional regulator of acetoin/glycerol metabolism
MGFFFETLCVRDLRVYAEAFNGKVYHYRDKNELECDAVVHLRDGRYGLIEIKLGGESLINDGAKTLNQLELEIIQKVMGYAQGNISMASKLLNVGRATFYRKLKELNFEV